MAPAIGKPQQGPDIRFPTLVEIKGKLPKDLFKASLITSLYYVARSVVLVSLLFAATYVTCNAQSDYYIANTYARALIWFLYWNIQGMVFWGIFVLGHDCGHASFSRFPLVNFIFGNILHSFILVGFIELFFFVTYLIKVPYESWKTTHRLHHKNTGNIDKDEIFYPHREDNGTNSLARHWVVTLSIAWASYIYGSRHLSPFDDIYAKLRVPVTISIGIWFVAAALAGYSAYFFGVADFSFYYLIPLAVFMAWLVITTFLHHQDIDSPWYGNEEWTYVKGNLSSVDRSYGPVVNNLIHNIGTHQIHHLFPKIPHYKLLEATEVFQKEFPEFVRVSHDSILPAFFRNWAVYAKHALAPEGVQYFSYRTQLEKSKKQ